MSGRGPAPAREPAPSSGRSRPGSPARSGSAAGWSTRRRPRPPPGRPPRPAGWSRPPPRRPARTSCCPAGRPRPAWARARASSAGTATGAPAGSSAGGAVSSTRLRARVTLLPARTDVPHATQKLAPASSGISHEGQYAVPRAVSLSSPPSGRRLERGLEHREVQQVAQPDHERGRDQRTPDQTDHRAGGALEPGGEEEAALEEDVGEQRLGQTAVVGRLEAVVAGPEAGVAGDRDAGGRAVDDRLHDRRGEDQRDPEAGVRRVDLAEAAEQPAVDHDGLGRGERRTGGDAEGEPVDHVVEGRAAGQDQRPDLLEDLADDRHQQHEDQQAGPAHARRRRCRRSRPATGRRRGSRRARGR